MSVACTVEFFACSLECDFGNEMAETSIFTRASATSLGALVMQIGDRATPDVMAQHLKITGHQETADISTAQRMGLEAFGSACRMLLMRKKELTAAFVAAVADKPDDTKPLPIEDTTMEPVAGTMETW